MIKNYRLVNDGSTCIGNGRLFEHEGQGLSEAGFEYLASLQDSIGNCLSCLRNGSSTIVVRYNNSNITYSFIVSAEKSSEIEDIRVRIQEVVRGRLEEII